MSPAVARAMEYGFDRQGHETTTIRCGMTPGCVGEVDFGTDRTIGFTMETCRSCRRSRRVVPNAADVAQARHAAELKAARRENGQAKKRYDPRQCELASCAKPYTPNSGHQRFCSPGCAGRVNGALGGRNRTLGQAGTRSGE